jgi:hypothetical protein
MTHTEQHDEMCNAPENHAPTIESWLEESGDDAEAVAVMIKSLYAMIDILEKHQEKLS